jgi:phytoene/squalene synthetase
MSDALAQLVARGDPDRHAATLAAPPQVQARLWPLYAFNLEIARAAWASPEPLVAQMRLQFWADVMDAIATGKALPKHEVAGPLAKLWQEANLPVGLGHQMIAARDWDVGRGRFADNAELTAHLQATGGNLMWLAALCSGAMPQHEAPVRNLAQASALANWFLAAPALRAAGCAPLPDESVAAIRALAQSGLSALATARRARAAMPRALLPVLLTGWRARAILAQAAHAPEQVLAGTVVQSEFARRGSLMLRALSGRW